MPRRKLHARPTAHLRGAILKRAHPTRAPDRPRAPQRPADDQGAGTATAEPSLPRALLRDGGANQWLAVHPASSPSPPSPDDAPAVAADNGSNSDGDDGAGGDAGEGGGSDGNDGDEAAGDAQLATSLARLAETFRARHRPYAALAAHAAARAPNASHFNAGLWSHVARMNENQQRGEDRDDRGGAS